jgi:hypothetical protein
MIKWRIDQVPSSSSIRSTRAVIILTRRVRAQFLAFYFIKVIAVFGASLVYQIHGRYRVVFFSQRLYIDGVLEAKIARSTFAKKGDVDRSNANCIAPSIVTLP